MYRLEYNEGTGYFAIVEASLDNIVWYLEADWEREIVLRHLGYTWSWSSLDPRAEQDEFLREHVGTELSRDVVYELEDYHVPGECDCDNCVDERRDNDGYIEPIRPVDRTRVEEMDSQPHENCGCASCKMARFEDSPLAPAVIQSYSYNPGWQMHGRGPYYLGVELETDSWRNSRISDGLRVQSEFPAGVAAAMRLPYDFWVAKEDGSVSGPEFCSHPATLDHWRGIRPEIEQMFTMLLHAGYRSHDNDTCGMHVNISRSAFASTRHLFRFLTLLHGDTDWALKMSQRSPHSMRDWANLAHGDTAVRRERMAQSYWRGDEIAHSTALNCPGEDGGVRFEFRLPRGTLRIDRFYKNLEWTVAMIEFSRRSRPITDITPKKFMEWVRTYHRHDYPDLLAFLDEKFPVAVAA